MAADRRRGALLTLATVVASGYALDRFGLLAPLLALSTHGLPPATPTLLQMAAGLLAVMVAPAALVATTTLVALALPALLLSALRLAAEMAGSRRWVPAARRYALAPALATLSYLTGALVALAWLLAGRLGLAHWPLLSGSLVAGQSHTVIMTISERAPLLALALALPYLALIELPFRLGLGSWRRAWLRDLRTRRTTIEAHVRRLSAPDPRTGAPDTSEETLRAMQMTSCCSNSTPRASPKPSEPQRRRPEPWRNPRDPPHHRRRGAAARWRRAHAGAGAHHPLDTVSEPHPTPLPAGERLSEFAHPSLAAAAREGPGRASASPRQTAGPIRLKQLTDREQMFYYLW